MYDLLSSDERFNVKILVTKTSCENADNPSYIPDDLLNKTYQIFADRGLNVEYAYDINRSKFIAFKKFKPDIVFYQHPW